MNVVRRSLVAACLVVVAGCSSGKPPAPDAPLTTPSLGPVPTVSANAVRTLPLAAYANSVDELATLSKAEGLLIKDCMRRLGFAQWQPPPPARLDAAWHTGLKIGIVDPQQAAQYGYHSPRSIGAKKDGKPATAQQRAELAALSGDDNSSARPGKQIPEGGCSGEAQRALRADAPKSDTELFGRLNEQASQATESDKRVVDAIAAWSDCMKQSGQQYRTPWEASEQNWPATPTPSELALAKIDVACKEKTGLPGIWFVVLSGYQQQLIERNKPALDAVRKSLDAELQKANQILSNGG